ncbi:microtubule-associated protein tau isoform X2 [Arctopsyche grandis]|uniref:microtubule-associated protein tau isoform X2 n=1 Tax=Arctopsyche grandis TaxID=121162 RepID=UPI00406D7041
MEPEATPPPGVKNRSFSIAGPPGAVPGIPQHDEERRRSVSIIGGRPEDSVSRGPGLAFIKEGVQSFESKESPLNVGLTRLSKEDVTRGSRESVRSDSSDGKGVERPESRLSGSKMTESIMGSLDSDERKNGSPLLRKNDDDDDVVTQNKPQNGTPTKSVQDNGHKVAALPLDRSPSLTSDSSPDPKPNLLGKIDSPNRPSSALSKTPEPMGKASPIPAGQVKDSTRPPSSASVKSEQRVDTPEPKNTEVRNGTPDSVNGRPASRAGPKPTDLGTPIKSGTPDDKKSTPVRKAASAPRSRREGDNDSGVDESTQGNEQVNGSPGSPNKKSPSKIPGLKGQSAVSVGKPGVVRSPSKSAAHTPNTPDSTTSNTSFEKKKVPMNKVQVGAAPSPNIKMVKSKIGSLENATHKPGGGKVRIENRKLDFNKAAPKIAAKNEAYVPGGGDKKITQKKLQWNAKSKIGSLENATHKPGGGDKKIETVKLDFKDKAKPKVASTVNITHKPGGGDVKIENQKLEIKAQSKVGSLDNVKHRPGGGDVKIFDDKEYLKQIQGSAGENIISPPSESPVPSVQQPTDVNLNQQS